jgi:uncharacterized protein YyaL (SSP411 family)
MWQESRLAARACVAAIILGIMSSAGLGDDPKPKHTNKLAREISPYLLQHAHNPVDWYPWGQEAFAKAKKENKLVFLSIGYSSCHWCHVMEKESFSNEAVAKLMNKWFVCIKVDREERPDIDNVYQTAHQVMNRRGGGWPLSMFLTADGKPIVGGTYWPPDDQEIDGEKVRGFKSLLKAIHDIHKEKPLDLKERADEMAAKTKAALASEARGVALIELNRKLVTDVVEGVTGEFDRVHGGFGDPDKQFRGTKFPIPPYLGLLQREAARTKSKKLIDIIQVTLDRMAQGGIYDHLGGGFHRYSTERTWTVPHFEKMLYDNAQLVEVYANAYRMTKKLSYRRVVEETLAFVAREMTSPEGVFYSALDADSDGEEGRFYVWTDEELARVLKDNSEVNLVKSVYGADGEFNFESKYHILLLPRPLADVAKEMKLTEEKLEAKLAPALKRLFEARDRCPRPFLDTKVLTGWNGQMIAGYAVAGQVLEEPKYLKAAARAADFLLKTMRTKDGRLLRVYGAAPGGKPEARISGYLDDYAYLVHGLLCLHNATNEKKWLNEAKALTNKMIEFHADTKVGGFFYTASDHEKLFVRSKDRSDGAQPSGNSVAVRNLVRLWDKTGEARYGDMAKKNIKAFAGQLQVNPTSLTALAEALAMYMDVEKKK